MFRALRVLLAGIALGGLSGCGDNPAGLLHEMLVFWNEVCDNTLRVTDDKSAQDLMLNQLKILDKQHVDIKERANKALGTYKENAQFESLNNALLDSYYEIEATLKRVKKCRERLINLSKASGQNTSIFAVLKWIEERKDFNNISLGSFSPNPQDPKAPKQIGEGLILRLASEGKVRFRAASGAAGYVEVTTPVDAIR